MLRSLFLSTPDEEEDIIADLGAEEILRRNEERVDRQDITCIPDSLESVIPVNTNGEERNVFNTLNTMQQTLKDMQERLDRNSTFRVEGQNRKDINIIAKRHFGSNIFEINDACKMEVSDLISEEMGRPAKPSEIRTAISHIKRKFSTEFRPVLYRKLKSTSNNNCSRTSQLRLVFQGYTDPSKDNGRALEYRRKILLIMRFVHRQTFNKGEFWGLVRNMFDEIEGLEEEKRTKAYQRLVYRDEKEQ